MSASCAPRRGEILGLFLLSAGVLLYELLLMRIFSVLMWYHFASLAIGLALLGLGAGGAAVGLRPALGRRGAWAAGAAGFSLWVLGLLAFFATVRANPDLARVTLAPFHQPFYEPFARATAAGTGPSLVGRLVALGLLAGTPFFLAGLATAGVLAVAAPRIHRTYAATFLGSAAGCLLAPLLLQGISAPAALAVAAALGTLGAGGFSRRAGGRAAAGGLCLLALAAGTWAQRTGGAEIPFARGRYEPRLLSVRWNAMSRVAAFAIPSAELNRAFGVSRAYEGEAPSQIGLVVDDSGYTNLYEGTASRRLPAYYRSNLVALAYHLRPAARALILGPGGGKDVWIARSFPGTEVTAVEINPQVVEMVQETFAAFTGRPYADPRVRLVVADARRFAATDRGIYDVIEASALFGRLPPAAGAFTLSEDLLHTIDAFEDYWDRLSPGGLLSLSRFSYEQRALRLVSLARALLDRRGVANPGAHIRVLSDRGLANVLVSKGPFTAADDALLRDQARRMGYTSLYPSAAGPTALSRLVDSPDLTTALAAVPFDVSPPTDDRPFFYYTLRPADFLRGRGPERAGFDDRGARILQSAFLSLGLLTVGCLILPPLLLRGLPGGARATALPLAYAVTVGLGYIALEIGAMKRLSLFLGHPIYAASATLFAFLVGGGAGSLLSARLAPCVGRLRLVLAAAVALGLLQTWVIPRVLASALPLPEALRWAVAAALLLPLSFVLGIPFPAGISLLGADADRILPWAWAANGAASVLGSLGSVLLAMNLGYSATLATGAALYAVAVPLAAGLAREAP